MVNRTFTTLPAEVDTPDDVEDPNPEPPVGTSPVSRLNLVGEMPNGVAGQDYSFQFTATGGAAPYKWENYYTTHPCCYVSINPSTGVFSNAGSGLKPLAGNWQIGIKVTDATGQSAQKVFNWQVGAAATTDVNSAGLKMLSPNGGELLTAGQSYLIQWKALNQNAVTLILYKGNNCSTGIAPDIQVCGQAYNAQLASPTAIAVNIPNTGSYSWTVPTFLPAANDYRIAVSSGGAYIDQSDAPFAIANTTGQSNPMSPTIPVITGPVSVLAGASNTYAMVSMDQADGYNGGLISYNIDWGDGTVANRIEPLASGVPYTTSHIWNAPGTYTLTVTAIPALGNYVRGTKQIVVAPASSTVQSRVGQLISRDGGTVFLVGDAGVIGIPSIAIFNSWCFSFSDVVTANSQEATLPVVGMLAMRAAGQTLPAGVSKLLVSTCPVSSPPSVSIKVVTPNGGEQWAVGSQQVARAQVVGAAPSDYHVALAFDSVGGTTSQRYYLSLGPSDTAYWVVGKWFSSDCVTPTAVDVIPGQYKMHAILYQGTIPINTGECLSTRQVIDADDSDAVFTIAGTSAQNTTGYCMVRDSYTSVPHLPAPDVGSGYAQSQKAGITTIAGLQAACSQTDFSSLLTAYCATNSNPVQQQVVLYVNGSVQSLSSGAFGSNFVSCPQTAQTLSVSLDPTSPLSQSVIPGGTGYTFLVVDLVAGSNADVTVSTLNFGVSGSATPYIRNLTLAVGGRGFVGDASNPLLFTPNLVVPKGATVTVTLTGDISGDAVVGTQFLHALSNLNVQLSGQNKGSGVSGAAWPNAYTHTVTAARFGR